MRDRIDSGRRRRKQEDGRVDNMQILAEPPRARSSIKLVHVFSHVTLLPPPSFSHSLRIQINQGLFAFLNNNHVPPASLLNSEGKPEVVNAEFVQITLTAVK